MRVVTAGEMRELDRRAIEEYGIPGIVLMENAGRHVAQVARQVLGEVAGKEVTVFAGKGNNGGDGLVVARHLLNMGAQVKVILLADPSEIKGDARVNLDIWHKMGQMVYALRREDDVDAVRLMLVRTDLIIDAIYGTGFRGVVKEHLAPVIEAINGSGRPVVAVDIPSGLEADTGKAHGPCVRATHTVTFALPKLGLILDPGAGYVGELHVVDISIPAVLTEDENLKRFLLTDDLVRGWLPHRHAAAHKGDFGRVLVVAGSRGMTGAAYLAAQAAARAGAGLVTLAVPEGVHDIMEVKLTEVMTVPLPDTGSGTISAAAAENILALAERANVVALGPGLSVHPETVRAVREVIGSLRVPCVVDADGLNALEGCVEALNRTLSPMVLTPHPGEMARLLGKKVSEVQEDRLAVAEESAAKWRAVVVLKGAGTLVAGPDGDTYINTTGNPGMATGGSGDVLTGVIAGLVAQGLDVVRAAAAGVYLHGKAGDLAAREKGMAGLLAGDVLDALPEVMREMYI